MRVLSIVSLIVAISMGSSWLVRGLGVVPDAEAPERPVLPSVFVSEPTFELSCEGAAQARAYREALAVLGGAGSPHGCGGLDI